MAVQNSLSKQNSRLGIGAYLSQDAVRKKINEVIGGENGQRLITAIVSATTQNKDLQACTNQSILSAALVGESLKLSPSPQLGQYYLVPFKNNKTRTTEAQFQLGYKGYIQLALRSGYYKKLKVMAIKEGELIQDERQREEARTTGYYAMFEYLNGFRKAMYWSREKMESHALKYSRGYQAKKGFTFWEKDFDGMAYKTMLRQLISKWGIMSIEMQTAFDNDMAVIHEDGTKNYVESDDSYFNNQAEVVEVEAEEVVEEVPAPATEPIEVPTEIPTADSDIADTLFN